MYSQITFRMDDITPGMDWQRFKLFVSLFDRYNLSPLLGIVPDNQDAKLNIESLNDNFWEIMRELKNKGWSIAQHGYQHTYITKEKGILGLNPRSEFAGLSFDEQYERILRGKRILEKQDLVTDIWMAPAHSYDQLTLKALKALGFSYVTDGQSFQPYTQCGLKFIPCQMETPCKIPLAIITVCIHSNNCTARYIKKLENFIQQHRQACIDFSKALLIASSNSYFNRCTEKIFLLLRRVKKIF